MCSDPNISDASPRSDVKPDDKGRIAWAIPYSTSKPRRDLDKAGQNCMVYDVIFNPNVMKKTQNNYNFRDMVNSTALEGVEKAFKLKLDRKRLRFPRLQFKGMYFLKLCNKISQWAKIWEKSASKAEYKKNSRNVDFSL